MAAEGRFVIVALHSEIRLGAVGDYVREHARIPDALAATFARVGIREWTIWRSGRRLFHLVDCEDWEAANTALAADPSNAAWQEHVGRYVELFRDAEGNPGYAPLSSVWRLSNQDARTRD